MPFEHQRVQQPKWELLAVKEYILEWGAFVSKGYRGVDRDAFLSRYARGTLDLPSTTIARASRNILEGALHNSAP